MSTAPNITKFKDAFWGPNGFDELRKLVKHGADFTKEVASVLNERSELETTYSKSLFKLATKLNKVARDNIGTTANAWVNVSVQMEREAETHRALALSLTEEVVKPLRNLNDNQNKIRKNMENNVDKKHKLLQDRRAEELKCKRNCYQLSKDLERLQTESDRQIGASEKDIIKLQNKRTKAIDSVSKADSMYYTSCVSGERARQEWEASVYECAQQFEDIERERLCGMVEAMQRYITSLAQVAPATTGCVERLERSLGNVNTTTDILDLVKRKGTAPNVPEQYLPDFYAEDLSNQMQLDRRKESLEKFLMMVMRDLEMERKGREGVENLARVFQETPCFGDDNAQADVQEKLRQLKQTLAFLEASRYKVQCALLSLNGQMRPSHPLSAHIEQHRDKNGCPQSILKIPTWVSRGHMDNRLAIERTSSQNSDSSEAISSEGNHGRNTSSGVSELDYEEGVDNFTDEESSESVRSLENGDRLNENPIYESAQSVLSRRFSRSTSIGSVRSHNPSIRSMSITTLNRDLQHEAQYFSNAKLSTSPERPKCKVLYDYEATLSDEMTLKQGDVVTLLRKSEDGWWFGECLRSGILRRGLFPATYVEEEDV